MSNILDRLKQKIQITLPKTNKTTTSGKGKEKKDMALYQPSNITPSTFAGIGGGIVDVNDNVSISWQVNGNSAMTRFDIQILTNETTPQTVHTFSVSSLSFYGTDKDGNPVFYKYEPSGITWSSVGLSNGEEYKMIITQYWSENGVSKSVVQNSASVFQTRAQPVVSISPGSSTLTSVTQTFTGSYSQAQGDSIAWARWILSVDGEVLDDTGTVYTPVLSYSYDGLFSGKTYSLSLTVETENGVEATATGSYPVSYTSPSALGNLDIQCNNDDSVGIGWASALDIPGTYSSGSPTYDDNGVIIGTTKSISWNQVNGASMDFSAPWKFGWEGSIGYELTKSGTATPTSSDWELVKMYKEIQYDNETVSVAAKDFERDASKDPTISRTITPSAGSHVTKDEYMAVTSTTYSPYTSALNIAGTVKATLQFVASRPLNTVNPVSLAQPGDEGYLQRFINFLPNTLPDPLPSYTMRTVLDDTRKCYWDVVTITIVGRIQDYNKPFGMYVTFHYDYYEGSVIEYPAGTEEGCRDYKLVSSDCYAVMFDAETDLVRISFAAKTTSPVSITYSYVRNYVGNEAYVATITADSAYTDIETAEVLSTTAPGGAIVQDPGGKSRYKVTFYADTPDSYTATVKLGHLVDVIGAESYRWIYEVTGTYFNPAVSGAVVSGNFSKIEPKVIGNKMYFYVYNDTQTTSDTLTYSFQTYTVLSSTGKRFFQVLDSSNNIMASCLTYHGLTVTINGTNHIFSTIPSRVFYVFVSVSPTEIIVDCYDYDNNFLEELRENITFSQNSVAKIVLQSEAASPCYCHFVALTSNVNTDLKEPMWDASMRMFAPFHNTLQAGTIDGVTDALSAALYRREGTTLYPLGTFPFNVATQVKDYAVRSNHEISYVLYYIASGKYSAGVESETFCKRFKQYTLTEAQQNSDGTYTALKTWRFANNIEASAVGNNNSPATMANFTRYPMWQPSEQSPHSGTLSALVGRFVHGTYSGETSEQMQELYNLSHSQNTLFLRDMKGNMYMVKPNGAISQKINDKSGLLEVTVSFPWVEVGDASKAVILKF